MSIARSILLRAADSHWLAGQMARRSFAKRAVRRFLPGERLEDALDAATTLARSSIGSLVTHLGEALRTEDEARAVRDHYLAAFDTIRQRGLATSVSVKPTQLGLDLSPDLCRSHLLELADQAESSGSSLWLDMEDSRYVDRTIELYRAMKQRHPKAGIAIQAYLRRTPKDVQALLEVKPRVRLVKGAYAEPVSVAFAEKRETDLAYFDLGRQLLEATARGQATAIFGTHDLVLIARLIATAKQLQVPPSGYEIHMLYGIRSADQLQLARDGQTVKTLISYGSAWFKWYMRRLAERPANVWFVMKTMVT
jgi:proline dehydrogenase